MQPLPPGKIEISPQVIATLAGRAVTQCYGVVGMAPRRLHDGWAEVLQQENLRRGVDVSWHGHQLIIELHVIMEHGVRIAEVARNIIDVVRYQVEKVTGLEVAQVNVTVEGLHQGKTVPQE